MADSPSSGNVELALAGPADGQTDGLKQDIHFTYDYSKYPSAMEFTVVPMADTFSPRGDDNGLQITALQKKSGREVNIACDDSEGFNVHLRYDPGKWMIDKVTRMNPFADSEKFTSICAVPEPGVLTIHSVPVSGGSMNLAEGPAAKVDLVPFDARRCASDWSIVMSPPGKSSFNIVWFLGYELLDGGGYTFHHTMGDLPPCVGPFTMWEDQHITQPAHPPCLTCFPPPTNA